MHSVGIKDPLFVFGIFLLEGRRREEGFEREPDVVQIYSMHQEGCLYKVLVLEYMK